MNLPLPDPAADERAASPRFEQRRDRLLSALVLMTGIGVMLGLPFALRAGAEFFLPVTAGLVVAVALVPFLEWLERRRVPSKLAAAICIIVFLAVANAVIAAILVPASDWVALLPERIGQIKTTIKPLIEVYSSLDKFINETASQIAITKARAVRTVTLETPSSLVGVLTATAPFALIQMTFAMLIVFFFLAGWSGMRRRTITGRSSFNSALTLARVIQDVVDATSSYIATITLINVSLGCLVAAALYVAGLPTPLMWGGIVALLNYIPYLGPIVAACLLALGGLMTFSSTGAALAPALIFIVCHLIESNLVTPAIVGRRLTINPLLILVSLSFWGWIWGALGALLAVPLLIIVRTVIAASGRPDVAAFLFEDGSLGGEPDDMREGLPPALDSPDPSA